MRIHLATPAPRGSRKGNRITAVRWAGHLRALGHRVRLAEGWDGEPCDLLVALHATKSHASVLRWRARRGRAPLVVGLAGTDLYQDLPESAEARRSLELADRLTVLQPLGLEALPAHVRSRARPILQSARAAPPLSPPDGELRVCLLAHLREVKDPFLGAEAVRRLAPESRIRLVHLGAALDPGSAERAREEMARSPRYAWWGPRHHREALRVLAGSWLLLVSSRLEGGANVVSEALAAGVPVVSSRVDGSMGVLGAGYPGLFPPGDAAALAELLGSLERAPDRLAELRGTAERLRPLVDPSREREAWRELLRELEAA